MNLEKMIDAYIASKSGSWSKSTLNSEKYRLRGVQVSQLTDGAALYEYLSKERGLKPYPLRTMFIRVGDFVEFLMSAGHLPRGENKVKEFFKTNAQLFKHAYSKKEVAMTFEEAAKKLNAMEDENLRSKALQLLYTGMRYTESLSLLNGSVEGKGGWHREVPMAATTPTKYDQSYSTLYRALKKIGLSAHMLRKLCATKLVELGATEADLMKIMGWRNSQMASLYVQAGRTKSLTQKMTAHLNRKELDDEKQVSGEIRETKSGRPAASRKPDDR